MRCSAIFFLALWTAGDATRISLQEDMNEVLSTERSTGGGQHICCCKEKTGPDQTCTWKEPWTLDTGSGCNFMGKLWWNDLRRVSGITNTAGKFIVFDTSQYAANEDKYKTLCSALTGEFVGKDYDTGSGEKKHHWFLKNDKFFDPEQIEGPVEVEEFTKSVKAAVETIEKVQEAPELNTVEVEAIDDDGKAAIEAKVKDFPKDITGGLIKKSLKEGSPGELCVAMCEPWPAPLGTLTPKNGCQVRDMYKSIGRAEKYCKNDCEGLWRSPVFTNGDCTKAPAPK